MRLIYQRIYDKLESLGLLDVEEYQKFKSEGFMDLHVDVIGENSETKQIALSHTYTQNGDVMADPDMEIRIHKHLGMAEALTFQNDGVGVFQRVYPDEGKVDVKLKKELNQFLMMWLKNIERQDYKEVKKE